MFFGLTPCIQPRVDFTTLAFVYISPFSVYIPSLFVHIQRHCFICTLASTYDSLNTLEDTFNNTYSNWKSHQYIFFHHASVY